MANNEKETNNKINDKFVNKSKKEVTKFNANSSKPFKKLVTKTKIIITNKIAPNEKELFKKFNLSIDKILIRPKSRESHTSRNYLIDMEKSESKQDLRLNLKESSYKSNNLQEKNKSSDVFKSQNTDDSFHFASPVHTRQSNKIKNSQKLLYKNTSIQEFNLKYNLFI